MKDWNVPSLLLLLGVLLFVPLLTEMHLVERDGRVLVSEFQQKSRREVERKLEHARRLERERDVLLALHECDPRNNCRRVDFNKDGVYENLKVEQLPGLDEEWLSVTTGKDNRMLLRLPFNDRAGDQRTRIAIVEQSGGSGLLVYDEVNYSKPFAALYRYDGFGMTGGPMAQYNGESFLGMAGFQDDATVGLNEFRAEPNTSVVKLLCYYLVLTVLVAVVLYRRQGVTSSGGNATFSLRGNP